MSKLKSMNSNTQPDCKSLPDDLCNIWAKKRASDNTTWHPLVLHMLDVAVVAEAILDREPESTKKNMAVSLGMEWRDARSWLLLIIACHDLGKACPGFQCLWPNAPKNGLRTRIDPNTAIHHGFLSQLALTDILRRNGWPEELASLAGEAVGCHHGD
ncbi:MAG: CRISPR-associated endonuclease Cas3'', partial [Elusimicrobiota bacterium]